MGTATWPLPAPARAAVHPRQRSLAAGLAVSMAISAAFALGYVADVRPDGRGITLLGMAVAGVAAWAALLRPAWLPLLFAAYLPYADPFPLALATGLNMTNLLLALGLLAWLTSACHHGGRAAAGGFELLLLAYLVMGGLGLAKAVSAAPEYSLADHFLTYKRWAAPVVLYFVVRRVVRGRRDVLAVAAALLWSTLLVATATWLDGYGISHGGARPEGRVAGIIGQPNSLGAFLAYYGILFLALALRGRGLALRVGGLAAFLIAARALMFTLSRGAYLALGGATALVLLLGNPVSLVGAAAVGAAHASAPEALPESVADRLRDTFAEPEVGYDGAAVENLDQSSAHRLELWRAGLAMARDEPWFGVGLGLFGDVVPRYTEEALPEGAPTDAHNAYILTLAELGVPAAVVMIVLLLWLGAGAAIVYFRGRTWVDRALALGFLGTLAAVAVSCSFGSRFSDENLIGCFWISAALVRTLRRPLFTREAP
jgi:O-antigen ligase